jgi:two-component system sensor histidine kinase YesM
MMRKDCHGVKKILSILLSVFKNMKFRQKLFISYIAVIIIPLIVLGFYSFTQARIYLLNQAKQGFSESVRQITSDMNFKLQKYNTTIGFINFNKQVLEAIDIEDKNYAQISIDYKEILGSLFDNIMALNKDINSLVIYSDNKIVFNGDGPIQSMSIVKSKNWFNAVIKDYKVHWVVEKNSILGLSRIYNSVSTLPSNLMCVDIDYNYVFNANMGNIGEYGILITDKSNNIVYSKNNISKHGLSDSERQIIQHNEGEIKVNGVPYILITNQIKGAEWIFYFYKPVDSITININSIINATILIILCCFVILVFITWIFSSTFVKRINYLNRKMKLVEEGDFKIKVTSSSNDEIGELIDRFSKMLQNINTLIDEVYQSHIVQKEAEMRALKAQINPHFLYNTLSLINWEAIQIKSEKIGHVTRNISKFYRTILNNGKNSISIEDEIANAKSYIEIQLAIHSNSFNVEYKIDDCVREYYMINIILQPIIENALEHGIYQRPEGGGNLIVSSFIKDECIYITIEDNGPGMDKEMLNQLFVLKSSGYGMKNVQERLKIIFGEEYGVSVYSELGKGTCVTVRIPMTTNPFD